MIDKTLIKKILLAFEQSSTTIRYGDVYVYRDGPGDKKQVTLSFGITEYGNLKKFLQKYCSYNTTFSNLLKPYIDDIGVKPLADNEDFKLRLKEAGKDPTMKLCQDQAYDEMYINPAFVWCNSNNLTLPLSFLVICDSFLQSGSILSLLRNKFPEKLPISGGDEKTWIKSYCTVRRDWLANHSRKILNNTVYRMDFMLQRIAKNDWSLAQAPYNANGTTVS